MRFLSMCWIILGHTLLFGLVNTENLLGFLSHQQKNILFLIVVNGFLCVDTFFVISGCLVGYVMSAIVYHPNKYKWIVYVLHRFIGLTPTLVITACLYICMWPHMSSGPEYPAVAPDEAMCRQ